MAEAGMTHEEMVEALLATGKFKVLPTVKDESENELYHSTIPSQAIPKVPLFSGDDPPQKGDVSYSEWRYEIRCLSADPDILPSVLVQAIRRSLRGTAKKILIPLGERATSENILDKLDILFGDISTKGMIMQEFFNSKQNIGETVTAYGCRLESMLQTVIDQESLNLDSKNDLLRHKFWTGLSSDILRSQTRHKYDTLSNYDELLKEIRKVEKEIGLGSTHSKMPQAGKKAQHYPVISESVNIKEEIEKLDKKIDSKLTDLEKKLDAKIENKFDRILSKLDEHNRQGSTSVQQPTYNRYRGRGRGNTGHYNGRGGNRYNREQNHPNA